MKIQESIQAILERKKEDLENEISPITAELEKKRELRLSTEAEPMNNVELLTLCKKTLAEG